MDTGANRALAASFVVAWQAAQARIKGHAELEAAAQLRPIAQTDYMAMRQAFALKFGEPEDKHVPGTESPRARDRRVQGRAPERGPLTGRDRSRDSRPAVG